MFSAAIAADTDRAAPERTLQEPHFVTAAENQNDIKLVTGISHSDVDRALSTEPHRQHSN